MKSLSQIPPTKVLKLTVPHRGMNENSDAPITHPKSGDHQMFNGALDFASIEPSTESRYNCRMIVNVMKRFLKYTLVARSFRRERSSHYPHPERADEIDGPQKK
jgi:hypothetical protein